MFPWVMGYNGYMVKDKKYSRRQYVTTYNVYYLPTGDLACESSKMQDALDFRREAEAEEPGKYSKVIAVQHEIKF